MRRTKDSASVQEIELQACALLVLKLFAGCYRGEAFWADELALLKACVQEDLYILFKGVACSNINVCDIGDNPLELGLDITQSDVCGLSVMWQKLVTCLDVEDRFEISHSVLQGLTDRQVAQIELLLSPV